jgi:hypothetical protein
MIYQIIVASVLAIIIIISYELGRRKAISDIIDIQRKEKYDI